MYFIYSPLFDGEQKKSIDSNDIGKRQHCPDLDEKLKNDSFK
jgi:hypothetical protein